MSFRCVVLGALAITGCATSSSVTCDDGSLCPENFVCAPEFHLCVTQTQFDDCAGRELIAPCDLPTGPGNCQGDSRVCLRIECGNARIDLGEVCDVALVTTGLCSSDCTSDGSCGNAIPDILAGEQCDIDTL